MTCMLDWKERCTIGITTRNRAEDLGHTLERLRAVGLAHIRYLITDDGSSDASPIRSLTDVLPRCRFVPHERCCGYVQRRNEMAEMCETEFLISLDDDAYFIDLTGMEKAIADLDNDPELGLVSFKIVQIKRPGTKIEKRITQFPDGPLYWFRGCGYLVRVATFLEVGGFPGALRHGAEELHLVHQFFRANRRMTHRPDVVVEHLWTPVARAPWQQARNFYRSLVMVKLLNYPWSLALAGVVWMGGWKSWHGPNPFLANITGWWHGTLAGLRERRKWKQLTWRQSLELQRVVRAGARSEVVRITPNYRSDYEGR
jgi:glycosyltransferase involved in cell wall biosynthesis